MNKEKVKLRAKCPKPKFDASQKVPVKRAEQMLDQYEEYFKQIEKELLARKEMLK